MRPLPRYVDEDLDKDQYRRPRSLLHRLRLFALNHPRLVFRLGVASGLILLLLILSLWSGILAGSWLHRDRRDSSDSSAQDRLLELLRPTEGDDMVTGVVLNWKRLDNVKKIVHHLCEHSMFREVIVWNNNPDIFLLQEHFDLETVARCRSIRIYNSPANLRFVARYLACMMGSGPYCYFQDDDWMIHHLRSFYANFLRFPHLVHTDTNEYVYGLTNWKWSFYRKDIDLHTCFSWVGTGAFASRETVQKFLELTAAVELDQLEFQYADMYFTTFMNQAPYQIENDLHELPQDHAFSGETNGIARNKYHIHKAVKYLYRYLSNTTALPNAPAFERKELHPVLEERDVRAPCNNDRCLFLTNIPSFPDVKMFQYEPTIDVDASEILHDHYDNTMDFMRHPYHGAVDGSQATSWRSRRNIQQGDYIALDYLMPIRLSLNIQLLADHPLEFFANDGTSLQFQVSLDGNTFYVLDPQPQFQCKQVLNAKWEQEADYDAGLAENAMSDRVPSRDADGNLILQGNYYTSFRPSQMISQCSADIDIIHRHKPTTTTSMGSNGGDLLAQQAEMQERGYRFVRLMVTRPEGFPFPFWVYEFGFRAFVASSPQQQREEEKDHVVKAIT